MIKKNKFLFVKRPKIARLGDLTYMYFPIKWVMKKNWRGRSGIFYNVSYQFLYQYTASFI